MDLKGGGDQFDGNEVATKIIEQIRGLEILKSTRPEVEGRSSCFGVSSTGGRDAKVTITANLQKSATIISEINRLLRQLPGFPPDFAYSSLQIGHDATSKLHTDKGNLGPSLHANLGTFSGGELVVDGVKLESKNCVATFDGLKPHYAEPFVGERFSIVAFPHLLLKGFVG